MYKYFVFLKRVVFVGVNHLVSKGIGSSNSKFSRKVSKIWPIIVPLENRHRVLPNDSSFGETH